MGYGGRAEGSHGTIHRMPANLHASDTLLASGCGMQTETTERRRRCRASMFFLVAISTDDDDDDDDAGDTKTMK